MQKKCFSSSFMRYLAFTGWMMTLSKHQDQYLNQQVILFRLQYEIHSLQMNPKSVCRSIVSPKPKLLEQKYALRLIVVPCWYFTSPSPFFEPISPSISSHISSVSVPHLLCRCIHTYCPAYTPPCSSAAVFTSEPVCYPYYPASPPRLHCYHPTSMLRSLLHYLPSFRVLCRRCLSTLSDQIFFSLYFFL